eukprot:3966926-Pyramimonas_sp.AAC.2
MATTASLRPEAIAALEAISPNLSLAKEACHQAFKQSATLRAPPPAHPETMLTWERAGKGKG